MSQTKEDLLSQSTPDLPGMENSENSLRNLNDNISKKKLPEKIVESKGVKK
ncbi:MAG: hypothetical protein ABIO55_13070 [Ginsengibacter sp.]